MVPTRELGIQVKNHIIEILKDCDLEASEETGKHSMLHNIKVCNVLGGFAKQKQTKIISKLNPEIIIATPGRLWELIDGGDCTSFFSKMYRMRFLVLDEADRMMEKGHFRELKSILDFIYSRTETTDLKREEQIKEKNKSIVESKVL